MNYLNKVGAFIKAHWPAIAAFILAAWTQFGTQIEAFVSKHPKWTAFYAFAAFTFTYYLKSPRQKP